ncbi:exopolysaccharide biosynthesis protein [Bradyrhizobium sp. CCBAU 45321]|uniref:polysaccharide biosynthesis tyrosine autokinase n=1 Tax=Bradyrhizobium sp. CCBAU 45321 TaxID=1641878 RepID=UPI002302A643|nr:polysaccharide biosynthesis tyrosine autokinase [Bradyrhizobium sp. CCBAU 45321]MDA9543893.1 exopolysaccharide biosynthesis protein [Bradyrhizobium sp. CCBAU 45321]
MLQVNKLEPFSKAQQPEEGWQTYLQILRRQYPLVVGTLACCLLLAVLYLFTAAPKFTATASLVIDTRKVQLFQQQSMLGDVAVDSATVETQVEILKSENISLAVIRDLKLTEDPEFTGGGGGPLGLIVKLITAVLGNNGPRSEYELMRAALLKFEESRTIKRVALTYVMEIGFTSLSPEKSERIANAIADAYIVDQLEAKYQATRRASVWLQDRIKELRTQASAAQKAVVDFKQANNIVDTGGRLMNEQQLAEINSQLIVTKAATAEAKARLERINDIMKQEIPDASVTDALKNETIVKLRNQYVDMAAKESVWSVKYGRDHLAAVNLRTQMQEIRKNITDELKRIQQAYKSDYDIAAAREDSIKNSLSNIVSESQFTNQAQIQLRELESNAQSYQAMYDNFLQRYMESVQQQSFPITEARVISPASRPLRKSSPKTLIVLAISIIGGLGISIGLAMARDAADDVFRTTDQVEMELQTSTALILPSIKPDKSVRSSREEFNSSLLQYVVDHPLSRFAEAVRSLKVTVDLNHRTQGKVVGITSTLPNEGKSTVSSNLAHLIAQSGKRVILIDGDLRNPSLSRKLGITATTGGLYDLIANSSSNDELQPLEILQNLAFLPAGSAPNLAHTSELLASEQMVSVVKRLKRQYDYVIVDMSPLAPVVDARVTTAYVDAFFYVAEWGKTKRSVIRHTLAKNSEIYDRLLGVILNKANTAALGRYQSYHGDYYYEKYYARYGYTE